MTDTEILALFDAGKTPQYVISHGHVPEWHARNLYKKWRSDAPGDAPRHYWKKEIKELADKGLTEREIFAETGYSYKAIRKATNPNEALPPEVNRPVDNTDSKMCSSCIYRFGKIQFAKDTGAKCNYIGITGHMRGCPADQCTRYQRGERIDTKVTTDIV